MYFILLFLVQFVFVYTRKHQQPIPEKMWSQRCTRNSYVLNDCNWCWCNENYNFRCKARVCEEVDIFGHFKDTIQEINVGMEGRGSWRTSPNACAPGVQYRRGSVLCVCDEDGNWPNPVCRDLFRILHSVEITGYSNVSKSRNCSPKKLHLVKCNVCLCPSTGKMDPEFCTNRSCTDDDPVLEAGKESKEKTSIVARKNAVDKELEIYATCVPHKKYMIGCQKCYCLSNNRLICYECESESSKKKPTDKVKSLCSGKKPGEVFNVYCNKCQCDSNDYMYCTAKKCLSKRNAFNFNLKFPVSHAKLVEPPTDDQDCTSGTTYKRGCNTCFCKSENGQKIFVCTLKSCLSNSLDNMARDCVKDTTYEMDCLICHCDIVDGVKQQTCKVNTECISSGAFKESRSSSLDSLHGYCEPLHVYKNSCNTCRCLADGKIVMCTTRLCVARSSEPVSANIVPIKQAVSEFCPEGYSYKIDCNVCYCLSNGNAICTTGDCSKLARLKRLNL